MAAFGVACAMFVHAVAAALGLSALFLTLPTLYHVLRWAGAAYLLYLAVKAFRDRSVPGEEGAPARSGMRRAFWQGAVTNLLNPKVILLRRSARVNRALNIVSGTVFTGLAVRLAASPK
jgi:threonine/homoserine/homoserine lactone efflux protein